MLNREQVKRYIGRFKRPTEISSIEWKTMKNWAFAVWEAHLMNQPWQYKLEVSCQAFFEMISTPEGRPIVKDYSLLSFAENENILQWKEELLELATHLFHEREREDALATIDLILAIDASFYRAWLLKARIELMRQQYKAAIASVDRVLNVEMNNSEAFLIRAQLHTRIGWFEKAIEDLNKAYDVNFEKGSILRLRAEVKWRLNDKRGAILDLKNALRRSSSDVEVMYELAEKQFEIGSFHDALNSVNTILLLQPNNKQALFLKSILAKELGDTFDSKKEVQLAYLFGNNEATRILRPVA